MGRGGQEWTERSGKAVMRSAEGGWVLNMGGPHGTPGLANERNIVRVRKGKPVPGQERLGSGKQSADVSGDFSEAKSETVSPDTVDTDISQPTVSVEEAGKTADFEDEMNDTDEAPSWIDKHSITCANCGELADEREATRLPEGELCARCATEHPELVPREVGEDEFNDAEVIAPLNDPSGYALRVRELEAEGLTTSDAQAVADAEFQKKGADISGDISEAKSEVDYNKAEIADEPKATDTVNPDHFAADEKKAYDESQPESVEFDFGAGDLADIVLVEEEDTDESEK
jgi:hypothetical protein